ncbi:MAG: ABC transporter permease [bacterium]|nr:ABC transporter permease [bacterium]
MKSKPVYAVAAVLSLVLGIGTNTAIFTVLDAVFLRPLPVGHPHELVEIYQELKNDATEYEGNYPISWPNYLDYRERSRTLSELAVYHWGRMNLSGGSEPQRATGMFVTPNYFDVLEVKPALGRFLLEVEGLPGTAAAAVLSHGCWSRLFGADPDILDKEVTINGHRFTIVGVGPRGFKGTEISVSVDFWVPIVTFERLSPFAAYFESRSGSIFRAIGRRNPGVSLAQVSAEMMGLAQQLAQDHPDDLPELGATALPLLDGVIRIDDRGRYEDYMGILVFAVVLILLIACISVVNLLLVRGMERAREISIRQALGANRGRIIRQLVTENCLLFLLSGALSMVVARWSMNLLWKFRPPHFGEHALDLKLDATVWGVALLIAVVVGLVFGLLPALRSSKPDLVTSLKDADPQVVSTTLRLRFMAHSLLAAVQVALALAAVIGAGLLLLSLMNAHQIELGFRTDHLALISVAPGEQGYDEAQTRAFYRRMVERVESISGVHSVALSENRLLRGAVVRRQVYTEGENVGPAGDGRPFHRVNVVGSGFFSTVGIPLIHGRYFTDFELPDGPLVAIINQSMAELWPDENPVGKRFHFDYPTEPLVEVVGVVGDAKYRYVHEEPHYFIYFPLAQSLPSAMTLHVRTEGDPAAMLPTLSGVVQDLDPNMPLADVEIMSHFVDNALWLERVSANLLSVFGILAAVLAVVGIYGVMAYSVGQRQREFGIRMAMGAQRADLYRKVLGEAAIVVLVGLAVGICLAFFVLEPVIASQLYEVAAADLLLTYVALTLLLALAALLGCLAPARRAAHTDPMSILRSE